MRESSCELQSLMQMGPKRSVGRRRTAADMPDCLLDITAGFKRYRALQSNGGSVKKKSGAQAGSNRGLQLSAAAAQAGVEGGGRRRDDAGGR